MADDASDGEVEDDADWRARVRRLRPFLLDADLVPPPPNPPDASSSCFASWTRLHAKAPEPPGGFASDAGAKALDALLRDPGARLCISDNFCKFPGTRAHAGAGFHLALEARSVPGLAF